MMDRARRRALGAYGALAALAVLAVAFGANLAVTTRRSVAAYEAYDALRLTLDAFAFQAADRPVRVEIGVGNPTTTPLSIEALELRLADGSHTLGGGVLHTPAPLAGGAAVHLVVEAAIDDESYVAQRDPASINWIITGRILVQLEHGEPVWIPFVTRYVAE